jgi:hypothetical protein
MTINTISNAVTKTVHLGTRRYAATLTVTSSGSVIPTADGAAGVLASVAGADLINNGNIEGGYGTKTTPGGIGVEFTAVGTITNAGIIGGGVGYAVSGAGIDLVQGGTLNNSGTITGGNQDYTFGKAGAAVITAGGTLSNSGQIIGGSSYGEPGPAGVGVDLTAATQATNTGTIIGGSSYLGTCGDGLLMQSGGTLINQGTILGGSSESDYSAGGTGAIGIDLVAGGTLQNMGIIGGGGSSSLQGRYGGQGGTGVSAFSATVENTAVIYGGNATLGAGGTGVYLHAGRLTNAGTINGGIGSSYRKGVAGIGLLATAGAMVTNTGTIAAGVQAPHYVGPESPHAPNTTAALAPSLGVGVEVSDHAMLLNDGVISGSNGAATDGVYANLGGDGTTGIYLTTAASAVNQGEIIGGSGGNSTYGNGGYGGSGGAGVYLNAGSVLTNDGTISGGAGGAALYGRQTSFGGNGGAGVFIDGGTLIDRGTIFGGAGGAGLTQGTPGDAVQFGSLSGTLEIGKSSVFDGPVAANAGVNDVLVLNAGGVGTLTGLGTTEFTGFTTVQDSGDWVLQGENTIAENGTLSAPGILYVAGTLTDAGAATVDNFFDVTGTGTAQLASLTLNGGTLSVVHTSALVVGGGAATSGRITLDAGVSIAGDATIGDPQAIGIIDNAAISLASFGDTLSFLSPVTGTGTITIGNTSALVVEAGLHTPSIVFSDGKTDVLRIEGTGSVTSTLTGFSFSDIIDERQLTVTSVLFANGTLTLLDGHSAVATLFLAGSYTTASFALSSDYAGGTDITLTGHDVDRAQAGRIGAAPQPQGGWAMLNHNTGPVLMAESLNPQWRLF